MTLKCSSMSYCTAFAVAPFDGKYSTSYIMTIIMFALSLTVCNILANKKTEKIFDHGNEFQWSRNRIMGLVEFNWNCSNPYR